MFIQNLAPGAAARAGFDSDTLRERHPRLITVDIWADFCARFLDEPDLPQRNGYRSNVERVDPQGIFKPGWRRTRMTTSNIDTDDVAQITAIMRSHAASLTWTRERDGNWSGFAQTFLPGAELFPAARPLKPQTIDQFVERLKRLRADGTLATLEETPLGCVVRVFGSVATALIACEMLENRSTVTRDVCAAVLVRDAGAWRIAAMAWDIENGDREIPADISGAA